MWEYAEGPPVLRCERQNQFVSTVSYNDSDREQEETYNTSKAGWKLLGNGTGLTLLKELREERQINSIFINRWSIIDILDSLSKYSLKQFFCSGCS